MRDRRWDALARFVYNLLLFVLSPLLALYLLWRLAKGKEDRAHWGERWGEYPESLRSDNRSPRIWVHAVSVGEVMAAAPVLRALRTRFPDALIALSTGTIGGREVARKQSPPADHVVYFPLDFPFTVRRAINAVRPDAVALMEWEIWPNFLCAARRRLGAKIVVLNGRISDRGLSRGRRTSFFTGPGLRAVDRFAMQSDEDARRAVRVGCDPDRVTVLGNTKFDEAVRALTDAERADLRADLGIAPGVPVWIGGSTRPGEEAIIAQAFARVRQSFPDLCLIVAPRHVERAAEVAGVFAAAGWKVARRSERGRAEMPPPPPAGDVRPILGVPDSKGANGSLIFPAPPELGAGGASDAAPPVLLLDTFGELGRVYAVADVAFVGGSLLPFGGQSVFQPLAQGIPALFGPHMNNQRDIAALSRAAGVGFLVEDADMLAAEVTRLLGLPGAEKNALGQAARALIARNQGVAERCADLIAELLAR